MLSKVRSYQTYTQTHKQTHVQIQPNALLRYIRACGKHLGSLCNYSQEQTPPLKALEFTQGQAVCKSMMVDVTQG